MPPADDERAQKCLARHVAPEKTETDRVAGMSWPDYLTPPTTRRALSKARTGTKLPTPTSFRDRVSRTLKAA